jgi:hypothetical protein
MDCGDCGGCDDCGTASQVINERKSDKNMEEVICKICLSIMIFPVTVSQLLI